MEAQNPLRPCTELPSELAHMPTPSRQCKTVSHNILRQTDGIRGYGRHASGVE